MARFAFIALVAPVLVSTFVGAAPLQVRRSGLARRAFTELAYDVFQISGGVAGNAAAEANAVFVNPFKGVDPTTISQADLNSLATMRSAAEDAETDFNTAIAAASGAAATALQNGKIKNKVLKLTGLSQIDTIKLAQAKAKGTDTTAIEASLADEQTKLKTNIALDVKAAGQKSTPIAGSDAEPVAKRAAATGTFKESAYSAFQISDGVAGKAEAEANAVFVDPFNGVALADISDADLTSLATMRSAAEDAETDFNTAIAAATGATADALQVGKIKNKVLKLTGLTFIDKIKIAKAQAAGTDTTKLEADLAGEQTKLTNNIATDVKSAGAASLPAP